MVEVVLEGLPKQVDEGTIQNWFFEEGDPVKKGDDLVELVTEEGTVTVQSPQTGILTEVYYDEGEIVAKGEVLCAIDSEEDKDDDSDEDEDDEDEDDDESDEDDDEDEDEEEDEE